MPTLPPSSPDLHAITAPAAPKWYWYWVQRLTVWSFWLALLCGVGIIFWGLWYVNERGFTRKWRNKVSEELARRGVYAEIGRLTLNPVKGIVAKEVKIRRKHRTKGPVIANVSELVLDIDYAKLVQGGQFVKAVDLHDATLSLPLAPEEKEGPLLKVSDLDARILLPENQLYLVFAEADVQGVAVSAQGKLVNPERLFKVSSGRPSGGVARQGDRVLAFLEKIKATEGGAKLDLRFSGDGAEPEKIFAEATLTAGPFVIDRRYHVETARLTVTHADGMVRLAQLHVKDRLGDLDGVGSFDLATKAFSFQLRSGMDLQGLINGLQLTQRASEFVFYSTPSLEVSGEGVFRAPEQGGLTGKALGRFNVGRFGAKSIIFEGAGAEFSWRKEGDETWWYVRDGHLFHRSGNLSVSALRGPEEFRFRFESYVAPRALKPLLPVKAVEELNDWDFEQSPMIFLEGRGSSLTASDFELNGKLTLGKTVFRGQALESLVSHVTYKNKELVLPDFEVKRKEGRGYGKFTYDFNRHFVILSNVRSTMKPQDVAFWVDKRGKLPVTLAPYRFRTPPDILIDGIVQMGKEDTHTKLRLDVTGSQLDYKFLGKDLFFPKVLARLWIIQNTLRIENVRGTSFGGNVRGNAAINLEEGNETYTADIGVEGVDFAALTKLYLDYDDSKGKLTGEYKFKGKGDNARSISGQGSLSLSDGNVYGIPIFGPFSGLFDKVLPGAGIHVARKANADFTMQAGVIETKNLTVDGRGFSLYGGGKLFVMDDKMDFSVRVNAHGAAGMLLTPVSHLAEYVSDGSLSNPQWRPKRLPKGMFKR